MSTLTSDGWQRTTPIAILFFIGRIVKLIAKNAWQSIAPLFVYISVGKEDLVTKLTLGGAAIVIAIIVGSVLSWLFFRYQISSESVLIRSGVIQKETAGYQFRPHPGCQHTTKPGVSNL